MKQVTPFQVNSFMLFKLPAAYICGVRLRAIDQNSARVTVRHRWINQNPFRSMFWAVQGMAAELACGMLVMQAVRNQSRSISMLLIGTQAKFTKKATGRIEFVCMDGAVAKSGVEQSLTQSQGVQFELNVVGKDAKGDIVSEFTFNWSVRARGLQ
ncbi:MAG TPA: thioesterase [Flavobacteriaceae bacterium]|nr:thioesterase [Flavobacteriaceae bacterium]